MIGAAIGGLEQAQEDAGKGGVEESSEELELEMGSEGPEAVVRGVDGH